MSWPFSNVGPPNLDTGVVEVPTTPDTITENPCWVTRMKFKNNDLVNSIRVTATTLAGEIVFDELIPPDSKDGLEEPFEPITGFIWFASAAGVTGHAWGYE